MFTSGTVQNRAVTKGKLLKVSSYQHVVGLTGLAGRASDWISWKSLIAFVSTNEEYSQKSGRLPVAKPSLQRQNTKALQLTNQTSQRLR